MTLFTASNPNPALRPWIALVAVWLMLPGMDARAAQDCEINGQAVNPANPGTIVGKSGLMRCKDHDSGLLMGEQQIQSGSFVGVVRLYEDGKLAKEQTVNAGGNLHGRAREFAPNGQVLREAVYDDGHEIGLVRTFYPSGRLRRVTFFADVAGERASAEMNDRGQLAALRCGDKAVLAPVVDDARLCGFTNGPSLVELFDDNGTLRSRLTYLAGKRMRSEDFYENGKTAMQDETAGNLRTERRFSSEGVKRAEVVSVIGERGAVKQRELEYSERGSLLREQRWNAAGDLLVDESYFPSGVPRSKMVQGVDGNARQIEIVEFYENGQRAAIGRYLSNGRFSRIAIGTHQRFADNGALIAESVYDAKGRISRERRWDAAGKLERDDEVSEDGSLRAPTSLSKQ